jgi:hypothetical protein
MTVLTFDKWFEKVERYLNGMSTYINDLIDSVKQPPNAVFFVDRQELIKSIVQYAYRTSTNRSRSYEIIE